MPNHGKTRVVSTDLEAARGGDDAAFARLITPYRRELRAHCYRMAGTIHDADDLLQESLVRAWRGLASFEGRASLRTWLYKVTTHACLDKLDTAGERLVPFTDAGRVLQVDRQWAKPVGCRVLLKVEDCQPPSSPMRISQARISRPS